MSDRRYGCHNRPRPAPGRTLTVQNGYHDPISKVTFRLPRFIEIPAAWSDASACRYDKQATDAKCAGCEHAKQEAP